jgi:tetratricopeptide (TPR) repeat protein
VSLRHLVAVVLPLGVAVATSASAQDFDPRGRHRPRPAPASSGRATSSASSPAGRNSPSSDQLIDRYTRIVLSLPESSGPLEKLAQEYRRRDGSVAALVSDFEGRAAQPGNAQYAALVALASIYAIERRPRDAEAAYGKALALRPRDPTVPLALARLHRDAGDLTGARASYETALGLQTLPADKRQTLRALMTLALDEMDWDLAARFHAQLMALDPTDLFARGELGRELVNRGEFERAVGALEGVVKAAQGDNRALAPALKELGRAQAKCHQWDKAVASLHRALAAAGDQPALRAEIYEIVADVYRAQQDLPSLLRELADEHPSDVTRLALLGRLYEETGDSGHAIDAYRRALASDPRQIDLRVHMVRLLQARGDLDQAIAEYARLLRAAPNRPEFVFEACEALLERGDRARALRLVTELEARSGGDGEILSRVADYYSRIGESAQSLRVLRHLADIDNGDPGHVVDLGDRYFHDNNIPLAVQTWKRLLGVVQPRAKALAVLGDVYVEHDMGAEALAAYKEALAIDPNALTVKKALAGLLERNHDYVSAVDLYEEIAKKATESANRALARECRTRIVSLWGLEHVLERQLPGLARAFERVPVDPEVGRMLAEAEIHLGRLSQAEETLRRVVALEPGDTDSYLALERVLVQQRKQAEAIAVLEKLAAVEPTRAREVYERMAAYALEIYRDDDAIRYAARAVELNPEDADAHRRLGEMYRSRQDVGHAIKELRAAIEKNDRLFAVYLELADLLLSQGEGADADALLRRVVRSATDEDLVARAARLAIQLEVGNGTLEAIERDLLPLAIAHPERPLFRRLLVEIYGTMTFAWVERVHRGQPQEAEQARVALSLIGSRAVKPLLDALVDDDVGQQRIAIDVLSYVQNGNAALPLFSYATGAGDVSLRARAMIACGALATSALVSKFAALLLPRGRDGAVATAEPVAIAAVWGLAHLHDAASIPLLRRIVREGSMSAQAMAALGLGLAGDKGSISDLATLFGAADTGGVARAAAAYALGELDAQDRVDALLEAAADEAPIVRRMALVSLARMAERPAMEPAWVPRAAAVMADAVFAGEPDTPRPDAPARTVARAAVNALAMMARGHARLSAGALPVPNGVLEVEDLLLKLEGDDAPTEDRQAALLRFSDEIERAASGALHASRDRARAVLDALGSGDGELRPFVERDSTGPAAARALGIVQALEPSLPALARGPDASLQTKALLLVAKLDGTDAGEAVASAIESPNESTRRVALAFVATPRRDGTRAHPIAHEMAAVADVLESDGSWSMRVLAAEAMGRLGAAGASVGAQARLRAAAKGDAYALVRQAALEALEIFDADGARELAAVMAQTDPEPRVRAAAVDVRGR